MWPFDNKKPYVDAAPEITVTETEHTEIITARMRTEADNAKLEVLHALLDITASEDLDALFVVILTEMAGLGYKLRDEPKALLERLKRQF